MIKLLMLMLTVSLTYASSGASADVIPDLTMTWVGFAALAIFIVGYYFVAMEEHYHIDKAKPALFIGTFMFMLIAFYYALHGMDMDLVHTQAQHLILEIAEIFFFL